MLSYKTLFGLSDVDADYINTNELTALDFSATNMTVSGKLNLSFAPSGPYVLYVTGSTGGTGAIGFLPYTSLGTGATLVYRDSNGNTHANNFESGVNGQAAIGTITLTNANARYQVLQSGSGTCTVVLPDATTLQNGHVFEINNNASGNATIKDNSGGVLYTIPAGGYTVFTLVSNSFSAGQWDRHSLIPSSSQWGTASLSLVGNEQISGSLQCSGTFDSYGTGAFHSDLNVNGNINCSGAINCAGTGNFAGAVNVHGLLVAYQNETVVQNLNVGQNIQCLGTGIFASGITVSSTGYFSSDIDVSNNVYVNGNINCSGAINCAGTGNFAGAVNVHGLLVAYQNETVVQNLNVGQNIQCLGTGIFASAITVGDAIIVSSTGYFNNGLQLTGNETITGNLSIGGSLSVTGNLNAYSDQTFGTTGTLLINNGTLQQWGPSVFENTTDIYASLYVGSGCQVQGSLSCAPGPFIVNGIYTVNSSMTIDQINTAIAGTTHDHILFGPGTYYQTGAFLVNRDNIVLDGQQGALLWMNTGVCQPNFIVGDISTNTGPAYHNNVTIQNFSMNGQGQNQANENMTGAPWVTNSCVWGTHLNNFTLTGNNLTNARSGGVTLVDCNDCVISGNSSTGHFFDSYTCYGCSNMMWTNNYGANCPSGALFSFDTANQYMTITGNTSYLNKLGFFMRDCRDITISGNSFSDNFQQGAFISGYGTLPNDNGCSNLVISGNDFSFNQAQGLWLQSVTNSTVSDNTINGNFNTGIILGNDNGVGNNTGSVSYCNFVGNTILNNGNYGVDASVNYSGTGCSLAWNIISGNFTKDINIPADGVIINDTNQINSITGTFTSLITNQLTLDYPGGTTGVTIKPGDASSWNFTLPAGGAGITGAVLGCSNGAGQTSWTADPKLASVYLYNNSCATGPYIVLGVQSSTTDSIPFNFPPTLGSSGNLLQTDGSGNTSWTTNITGATGATGPSGVVNIVSATDSSSTTNNLAAFVATNLSASITPHSSSNKVLITVTGNCGCTANGTCVVDLFRGISSLSSSNGFTEGSSTSATTFPVSISYLDSPASTSSTTYKVYIAAPAGTAYWNNPTIVCNIILQEIFT